MNTQFSRSERSLLPSILSLLHESEAILYEMASELNVSIDELISAIVEDSVLGLKYSRDSLTVSSIPDKCSRDDLLKALE